MDAPDDLDPGIAPLVTFLRSRGFTTTDSGDGSAKFLAPGAPPMECALGFPHVAMTVTPPEALVAETRRLQYALVERSIRLVPSGAPGWTLQGSYDPADNSAILFLALHE